MNKKGINDQIFIFIFAIIVIGLIVLFGAKYIIKTRNMAEQVEVIDFLKNVKSNVERVYDYDVGSKINLDEVRVPGTIKEVCFDDGKVRVKGVPGKDFDIDNIEIENLRIKTSLEDCRDNINGIEVVFMKEVVGGESVVVLQ